MKKDWIKRLPPGEYDIKQIKEFAGLLTHASTKIILLKYGATVRKEIVKGTNFMKDVFTWPGFKHKSKDKIEDK